MLFEVKVVNLQVVRHCTGVSEQYAASILTRTKHHFKSLFSLHAPESHIEIPVIFVSEFCQRDTCHALEFHEYHYSSPQRLILFQSDEENCETSTI